MSYCCYCCTIAFGDVRDVCEFVSRTMNLNEEIGVVTSIARSQWNGCHYAIVSHKVPEGRECHFWDRIIPQFPQIRFLLSRTSERDGYLTEVVRHRHSSYGFNSCLLDHTTSQTLGEFPSDRNPISVLDDFHDEVLRDGKLSHACGLLGYPVEMLVGCGNAESA